ncbi:MAG: hypothetical protein DWH91_13215 [Planctomycetota bacterium]|nr:MAG: hypothetical protein DWH91_13215 [Planctomycetota bacterium]
MSFVGKMLVVVLVVLSVLFMALSGGVLAVHNNWRTKHDTVLGQLKGAQEDFAAAQANATAIKQTSQKEVDDAKKSADTANAALATQTDELVALQKQVNELQLQMQTQTALAETNSKESDFRNQESLKQRAANRTLQAALDQSAADVRQLEDDKFGLQVEFDKLKAAYNEAQVRTTYLEGVAKKYKWETDPHKVARMETPPPPVEGLVKVVTKDKTNRPKFVEISIGADDGLIKGHKIDVVRLGLDGKDSQYMGKIQLTDVGPDHAVGIVIEAAKNGIIEVGDNVTTKL